MTRRRLAMSTDQPTPSDPAHQTGPEARLEDIRDAIEHERSEAGETGDALTGNADVRDRLTHKVAHTKDRIAEKANEARGIAAEKAHAAEPTVRKTATEITGFVKPRVPMLALIAAAIVITVVVRRRR
jgi:hypothetical protein